MEPCVRSLYNVAPEMRISQSKPRSLQDILCILLDLITRLRLSYTSMSYILEWHEACS